MKARYYDAIEETSQKFGGVGSGRISSEAEGGGTPWCPWGMLMYSGAVNVHPYGTKALHVFGKTFEPTKEPLDVGLPDLNTVDWSIWDVRKRKNLDGHRRVPWSEVAKEMNITREEE
jgi:hypothetical protein